MLWIYMGLTEWAVVVRRQGWMDTELQICVIKAGGGMDEKKSFSILL